MKLTVLQTLPALEVGGVERGTLQVARALVERGHRSIVISADGRLREELCDQGSEHHVWPIGKKSLSTFTLVPKLSRFLQDSNIDILHSRSRLPAWVSYLALKKLGRQQAPGFITTVHGPYSVNRYSRIMTTGEKVIAISNYIRDYIQNNYNNVDMDKVHVIHRGVNSEDYPFKYQPSPAWLSQWQQTYPQLHKKKLITLPARITRWKGHEDFIDIIKLLIDQNHPVHGVIAGSAHPKKQAFMQTLQQLVQEKRLQEHITFIGHRDDMRDVMAVSDIVLSLAKTPEAFGRTGLEALCLGVPVVAYDHGGATEVLTALQPQGLVPAHNTAKASEVVADFLQQAPTIKQNNPFTLDNMLNKTIAIYEQLYSERQAAKS